MADDRYDPDAEIRARALEEIAETVAAAQPSRRAIDAYRSEAPGAVARRALLRELADQHRARHLGAGEGAARTTANVTLGEGHPGEGARP